VEDFGGLAKQRNSRFFGFPHTPEEEGPSVSVLYVDIRRKDYKLVNSLAKSDPGC
jgi:hypothetical protein